MIYPVPKPKRVRKLRQGSHTLKRGKLLKRTRMKCGVGSKRRKGSSFPKQRDAKYRRWIRTENACLLAGRCLTRRLSTHDTLLVNIPDIFGHVCWGDITPAHVGEHQARGAPDFGVIVPLCQAAHDEYDNHRWRWREATRFTEKQMASAASGYALKYTESGGFSTPQGAK